MPKRKQKPRASTEVMKLIGIFLLFMIVNTITMLLIDWRFGIGVAVTNTIYVWILTKIGKTE